MLRFWDLPLPLSVDRHFPLPRPFCWLPPRPLPLPFPGATPGGIEFALALVHLELGGLDRLGLSFVRALLSSSDASASPQSAH